MIQFFKDICDDFKDICDEKFGIILLLLILAVPVLVGVGIYQQFRPPKIIAGTVVFKQYNPAESTMTMIPISTGKTVAIVPIYHYHKENWMIKISENEKTETFYIPQKDWEKIKVGDYFKVENCSRREPKFKISKEEYENNQ